MKIKEDYVLREVAGQNIVVPIGSEAVNFNGIITLNNSAKKLYKQLQVESTFDECVNLLLDAYEVTLEQATKDVKTFLEILKENNLLNE